MILHIADDQRFINGAVDGFETYYPGRNRWVVQIPVGQHKRIRLVSQRPNIRFEVLKSAGAAKRLLHFAREEGIRHVLVHQLDPAKARLALLLKRELGVTLYWIFFGADLYGYLSRKGKYELYDDPKWLTREKKLHFKADLGYRWRMGIDPGKTLERFVRELDHFCFWNEYDHKLLQSTMGTDADLKYFIYWHVLDTTDRPPKTDREPGVILVNHSGNLNGNHRTVLERLQQLDESVAIQRVIAPLTYGDPLVIEETKRIGKRCFGSRFEGMQEHLPMGSYYRMLDGVSAAVFGNRRQQAGGNVFYLLKAGVRVYLRNDNNLLQWLRDRGFHVFSFEDDLKTPEDLRPLSPELMISNFHRHQQVFSPAGVGAFMRSLIDGE